ncbi:MAG: ferrochelatase, partial [Halioglobus sp.]|nr:ferrochelatase [Halioglobus sp.]
RFGRQEWLRPYTDDVLKGLPRTGVKRVQVICPGFASDCLETLEEINQENRAYFLEAGGDSFQYIPCLNSSTEHIAALAALVTEHLHGWFDDTPDPEATRARAAALDTLLRET